MVNPGAFSGSRKAFLEAQKDLYAAAVSAGHVADTVADIQRRYFKRYPITLPHGQEPTQRWLDQVDDDAIDPEIKEPDADAMDAESWSEASLIYNGLVHDLKMRKDQIKRRLQYQHCKARNDATAFEKGSTDPMALLMAKLTGEGIKKPRMKTAYNLWGPEHRFFVDPIFQQRVEENEVPAKQQAALRSSIYKELFDQLPEDEQEEWVQRAEDEHREALESINRKLKAEPSMAPEARQKQFVEPILDLIAEYTGWKVTFIAGGPEPADGGRLNMVSIHSGVTTGTVKMDFGRSERFAYKAYVEPAYGSFLSKCYSINECRSRALPIDHTSTSLATLSIEENLQVHRFDIDPGHVKVSRPALGPATKHSPASAQPHEGTSRKGKNTSSMQSGTPSVPVRFGPPIGRKKNRPLPSKDRLSSTPGTHRKATSPLAQNSFTATELTATSSASNPPPISAATAGATQPASASAPVANASAQVHVDGSKPDDSAPSQPSASLAPGINDAVSQPPTTEQPPGTSNGATSQLPATESHSGVDGQQSRAPSPEPTMREPALPPFESFPDTNGAKSRAPTPAPSPNRSRAPTPASSPARSRGPTPAPSPNRSRTPTPASSPARSRGTTPAPSPNRSRTPTSASSPARSRGPTTAPSPNRSHTPTPASSPARSRGPTPAPSPNRSHAPTPASSPAHSRGPTLNHYPAPIPSPPARDPPAAATPTNSSSTRASTRIHIDSASALLSLSGAKPPGTATVPDPSSMAAYTQSSTKSRKRKAAEEEDGDTEGQGSKRTRSSAQAAAGKRKAPSNGQISAKKMPQTDNDNRAVGRAFSIRVPNGCPSWVSDAIELLTAGDLGAEWQDLVAAWLKFEEGFEFQEKGAASKLSARGRPRIVADWIKRARTSKYRPNIGDLIAFETTFKSWWRTLQPEWRLADETQELRRGHGDWDALKCSGVNGLLSAVAALFFWGMAAATDSGAKKAWSTVVDDVLYALTQIG